jgi:hypothetical protein
MRRRRSRAVPCREGDRLNPAVCLGTVLASWPDCRSSCPTPAEEAESRELSESSHEIGPSLTSMAVASTHTLEVSSIRVLTAVFIGGLD